MSALVASLLIAQQGFLFSSLVFAANIAGVGAKAALNSVALSAAGAGGAVRGLSRVSLGNIGLGSGAMSFDSGVLPSVNNLKVAVAGAAVGESVVPAAGVLRDVSVTSIQAADTAAALPVAKGLELAVVQTAGESVTASAEKNPVTRRAAAGHKALEENTHLQNIRRGRGVSAGLFGFFSGAKKSADESFVSADEDGALSGELEAGPAEGRLRKPELGDGAGGKRAVAGDVPAVEKGAKAKPKLVEFRMEVLKGIKGAFVVSMTRPDKQDYTYLVTKTFGVNLAVRLFFVVQGVMSGGLGLTRAIVSTAWYQIQDAVFTVFGQTYMKFLDKMTDLLTIRGVKVGDFIFIYGQLVLMEFINRLLLGPLGENPLVYSWAGLGLIFVNVLMGMVAGGPLVPAINKMHRSGAIKHSTMMHFYQISSMAMHLGLLATFGMQTFYIWVSVGLAILSWGLYLYFSIWGKTSAEPVADPLAPAAQNKG